jgi:hypothetical protein
MCLLFGKPMCPLANQCVCSLANRCVYSLANRCVYSLANQYKPMCLPFGKPIQTDVFAWQTDVFGLWQTDVFALWQTGAIRLITHVTHSASTSLGIKKKAKSLSHLKVTKTDLARFPIQLSSCIIALRNVVERGLVFAGKCRLFKLKCYIS